MRYTIYELDNMNGFQFESAIADLLFHNGYRDISVTQKSGDYGIDILARKKDITYGIQCKRYKNNVGIEAVQQAATGSEYYGCKMAAVITNSHFTSAAKDAAGRIAVRLWDREFVEDLIKNYSDEYDLYDKKAAEQFSHKIYVQPASDTYDYSNDNLKWRKVPKKSESPSLSFSDIKLIFYIMILVICGIVISCENKKSKNDKVQSENITEYVTEKETTYEDTLIHYHGDKKINQLLNDYNEIAQVAINPENVYSTNYTFKAKIIVDNVLLLIYQNEKQYIFEFCWDWKNDETSTKILHDFAFLLDSDLTEEAFNNILSELKTEKYNNYNDLKVANGKYSYFSNDGRALGWTPGKLRASYDFK